MLAYGGRYGKQPMSEMLDLPIAELIRFINCVSRVVDREMESVDR